MHLDIQSEVCNILILERLILSQFSIYKVNSIIDLLTTNPTEIFHKASAQLFCCIPHVNNKHFAYTFEGAKNCLNLL